MIAVLSKLRLCKENRRRKLSKLCNALQVIQMWNEIDGSISSDSTVIKTKCKRELSKLNSKVLSNAEYVRQIKEEKRRSEAFLMDSGVAPGKP
ncbi:hypothetical protein T06_13807 [Trichinella sp. T6]|nr:hypothetical protein T06_13807 [Trichinella sp. T6]